MYNHRDGQSGRQRGEIQMTAYIALLRKTQRSDFGVDFPDFPGCVTAGRTLEEARKMAQEALAFHVAGMRDDGLTIPPPRPLDAVDTRDAVAFLVELPDPRAVRVNLTVPATDLAIIDEFVKRHEGESRSGLMVKGAMELIGRTTLRERPGRYGRKSGR